MTGEDIKQNPQITLSFPLKLNENEITVRAITTQIGMHLLQRALKEGGTRVGQSWEDIKQMVNETVQNLSK
jgi:hypothetical protein